MTKQKINKVEMTVLLTEFLQISQYKKWNHIKMQNYKTKIQLEGY